MASHRKPPARPFSLPTARAALALALAGAASATSFAGSGHARPQDGNDRAHRSTAQVKAEVNRLHREAERATEKYNGAQEKADAAQRRLDTLSDEAARGKARLNASRHAVGSYATAQYREGSGADPTLRLALSSSPDDYLERASVAERAGERQAKAVGRVSRQARALRQVREEAEGTAATLATSADRARAHKRTVRAKLREADALLDRLSAAERAKALRAKAPPAPSPSPSSSSSSSSSEADRGTASGPSSRGGAGTGGGAREAARTVLASAPAPSDRSARAVAFARQAVGTPYVWGATGPSGYDCSGLTQAAWRAAGVSLPRTTYAQIESGTRVPRSRLAPGDLVFFYGSVSHVGLYVGNGHMIHAPRPGTAVRVAPISEMPFAGAVRPG